MKRGWQTRKLGDICNFEGGSQPPKSKFIFEEKPGYVRFLQIRDFRSDKNITYIPESKKNSLCEANDILIGRYGASVGKILTNKAGAYNVAMMKAIPNFEILNRSWFYNYLISDEFQSRLLKVADRSAQAGFSKDDIFNFPVPIPPLSEQQRIVGLLDEAFDGIATAKANAEKNLQNARALFESHLQSVFTQRGKGWVEKKLGEICSFLNRGISPRYLESGGICVLNQKCIRDHRVSFEPSRRHDINDKKVGTERLVQAGDVLVNSTGTGTLGRVAQLRDTPAEPTTIDSHVTIVRPIPGMFFTEFFGYMLVFIENGIKEAGEGCGGQTELARSVLAEKFSVSYPISLADQKQYVAKLDGLSEETQRLARIYDRKIAALRALKKSLLHQAFTGELTKVAA